MPIELTWLIPNKILLSRWSGIVGADDMRVLVEELAIILDAAEQPIHTLIDLTDAERIEPEIAPVYLQSPIPNHARRGRIGVVGATSGVQPLADLMNRSAQREMIRLFRTRAEAREFFDRSDTLPPVFQATLDRYLRSRESPGTSMPEADSPGMEQ